MKIFKKINSSTNHKIFIKNNFNRIIESIYKEKGKPHWDLNFDKSKFGVYEYNSKINKFEWSPINFYNTNYSIHSKMFLLLKDVFEKKLSLNFNYNNNKKLMKFCEEYINIIEKHKHYFFVDPKIRNILDSITNNCWGSGLKPNYQLINDYKLIWPEAIKYDGNDEKGRDDDFKGIDGKIIYKDKIETIQNKNCDNVLLIDNKFYVYCDMNIEEYNDINYFCFYPKNDINYYVFKNDKTIKQEIDSFANTIIINKTLLKYKGEKKY